MVHNRDIHGVTKTNPNLDFSSLSSLINYVRKKINNTCHTTTSHDTLQRHMSHYYVTCHPITSHVTLRHHMLYMTTHVTLLRHMSPFYVTWHSKRSHVILWQHMYVTLKRHMLHLRLNEDVLPYPLILGNQTSREVENKY